MLAQELARERHVLLQRRLDLAHVGILLRTRLSTRTICAWLALSCFAGAAAGCLTNQPAAAHAGLHADLERLWVSTLNANGMPP